METNEEGVLTEEVRAVTEPQQKTVWQADLLGFLLYPAIAHELALQPGSYNVPFGALEVEPLPAPAGMVNRANEDWTSWQLVEDHRRDQLYYLFSPATDQAPAQYAQYVMNTSVEIDGVAVLYDGGGPVPAWLLTELPAAGESFSDGAAESGQLLAT